MLCLPYFPREMPSHRCPVLEVCFFKNIKGVEKLMKEYEEEMSIRQLSRGFELQPPELPDIIKVNWGLKDRCGESQVVLKSELNQVMEKLVIYFPIDFKDEPNDSLITLTFNGTPRTIFNARFHRKTETAGTSMPQFADGSPEKVKELTLRRMMKLADHLHPDHYVRLGILLGFKNAELSNILMMNQNDYCTAYSVMLYHWLLNTPHAERIERFEETLRDAQLKGLIDDLWKD
ncbi:uncharacterized protein [Diadema setosum]|uniref:uncharacterized protein n=1 Tax=Diadema setosum TaxID=31175 RepID=UPI003B3A669F